MELADYYVVPSALLSTVKRHYDETLIWSETTKGNRCALVFSSDRKLPNKVDIALHFHDDEGAAWGFTFWEHHEEIASGLFGENAETGVDPDDNYLEGDLDALAIAFAIDANKLTKIFEADFPDSGAFAKLIGFPFIPISASEAETELNKAKKKASKTPKKPKKTKKKNKKK